MARDRYWSEIKTVSDLQLTVVNQSTDN